MRKRIIAALLATALAVASIGSAGAYWTVDNGPSPARCGYWQQLAEQGNASAAYYFDHYGCVWVEE